MKSWQCTLLLLAFSVQSYLTFKHLIVRNIVNLCLYSIRDKYKLYEKLREVIQCIALHLVCIILSAGTWKMLTNSDLGLIHVPNLSILVASLCKYISVYSLTYCKKKSLEK